MTLLYNPVFINPQAYFVFPQLYNIEPNTEDYIEKAIYTGTLHIVSTDQTSARYYENTNEIDLSDFANKTIRISQYTDDGAAVLGEWQIGSNDIVIPKPIRDAMVCWYDPLKQGLTNEDIKNNVPLKDFSGNKLDGQLRNFAGEGSSGVGKYAQLFNSWIFGNAVNQNSTKSYDKFHIVKNTSGASFGFVVGISKTTYNNLNPYKLKITHNGNDSISFKVVSTDGNTNSTNVFEFTINSGDNIITIPVIPDDIFNNASQNRIYYSLGTTKDLIFDIEQIPDYPNQIVFDGIDDYIYCPNQPILTDYTVMAARTNFGNAVVSCLASKSLNLNGAFIFELINANSKIGVTYSFYVGNHISINNDEISYQTSTSYNGSSIKKGTASDTDTLCIGTVRQNDYRVFKGAIRVFLLFNRTLTTDEITWVKKNLMGYIEPKTNLFTSNNEIIQTVDGNIYNVEKKTILTFTGEQLENILDKINNEL